jgi:hypothetical protein
MCVHVDSETANKAPKSGAAKPNRDYGKTVKASLRVPSTLESDILIQFTENMETRQTDSHQYQQFLTPLKITKSIHQT